MKVRPKGSGMMLRLVDVVLILLFGFLMIAKIQLLVDIDLPQSQGDNAPPTEESKTFDVYIYSNGLVATGPAADIKLVVLPLRTRDAAGAQATYEQLRDLVAQLNKTKKTVVIQSEFEAPVQFTVDMLDICKELDMPKSIRCFEAMGSQPPAGG